MNDPRFGRGSSPPSHSAHRDQQRETEEAIKVVIDAIKELLDRPKNERDEHLSAIREHLREYVSRCEEVSSDAAVSQRLRALDEALEIVEEISAEK